MREQLQPGLKPAQFESRWVLIFKELSLFASLCLAWLMIWKELRRERKERLARIKRNHLAAKEGSKTVTKLSGET